MRQFRGARTAERKPPRGRRKPPEVYFSQNSSNLCPDSTVLRFLPMAGAILTGISGLDLLLAHHTLLLPSTQRICDQRRPQQGSRGSDGSFLPSVCRRTRNRATRPIAISGLAPVRPKCPWLERTSTGRAFLEIHPIYCWWCRGLLPSGIGLRRQAGRLETNARRMFKGQSVLSLFHAFLAIDATRSLEVGSNLKRLGSFQKITE